MSANSRGEPTWDGRNHHCQKNTTTATQTASSSQYPPRCRRFIAGTTSTGRRSVGRSNEGRVRWE
jgi:hypothetical protein